MSTSFRPHAFFLGIIVFNLVLLSAFTLKASTDDQLIEKTEVAEAQLSEEYAVELFSGKDNFLRRLLGFSSKTNAEKSSRSERLGKQPKKHSPPKSNSKKPTSYNGDNQSPSSNDPNAVKNNPKPPLQKSLRDQHQSLGYWELGLSIGTSHAISDIAGNKDFPINEFTEYHTTNYSMAGGFYGRYIMNEWFAMNLGMNFANLKAEREFVPEGSEAMRFNNDIFEFYAKTEFRLPALSRSPFDLYGFVGIGVFFSDASIYDKDDRLITTQDDYSQVQPVIPFGGGFSVKITNNLRIGYELGWRNTIFHYLDGVKSDEKYDHYFLNSLKIGFVF